MENKLWTEINNIEDLPDENIFCWWVNRTSGSIHPSMMKGQLGRSLTHLTFSHYMIIDGVPNGPEYRRPLDKLTSWNTMDINEIMKNKIIKT